MAAMETDINAPPSPAPAGEAGPSSSSRKPSKRFEIKKWNAVALWAWDIVVDNCAICRNHIMDLCIECQANQASATSEECTVAWELPLQNKLILLISSSCKDQITPVPSNTGYQVSVIMLFTSTASAGGSRLAKCAH